MPGNTLNKSICEHCAWIAFLQIMFTKLINILNGIKVYTVLAAMCSI